MKAQPVHVAAAAVLNDKHEVLISRRQAGTHLAGCWEFPGGKVEHNETAGAALCRELEEELGIRPTAYRPLIRVRHDYPDRSVLLDVWRVAAFEGSPAPLEGQAIRWQRISELDADEFPAADIPVIRALRLPDRLLISGRFEDTEDFCDKLERALGKGIRLVQLRLKADWLDQHSTALALQLVERAADQCRRHRAQPLLNLPPALLAEALSVAGPDCGIHLDSRVLAATHRRPQAPLVSASCHSIEELHRAQTLGADFALLSPVRHTQSHPDTIPLGWTRFSQMLEQAVLPVFALGGVGTGDLEAAWQAGAQGVAAISAYWEPDRQL
jgi:8-oxo-dGTP diphosphatase